jgi:hypothetical protein
LNANIGDFNMGDIILYFGSKVNVMTKKTWEVMGEPTLGYSPIQLKLENQHRVVPIGRLKGIPVDFDGVCTMADFEVIDIVDNTTPYPTLLGLDWEFHNQDIINLKTKKIIFESREYRVISPLDPSKGGTYIEPASENFIIEEITNLYITNTCEEYYINPKTYGIISWRSISSCALDSDTVLENWQQCLHDISTRRCARMMHALRWVGTEVREPPTFYGQNDLEEFLVKFELDFFFLNQRSLVLDMAFK